MTHTPNTQSPSHPAEAGLASPLVAALEATWAAIQHRHREIPDVVIVVAAGSVGVPRGALKLGHFAARRWTHAGTDAEPGQSIETAEAQVGMPEVFVGGEGLALGAVDVLGTLLHEATHALAHVRGIQDTSRQGRYHSRKFRDLAEEMGLFVAEAPGIGWSDTFVPEAARTDYAQVLDALSAAIRIHRRAEGTLVPTTPGDQDGAVPGPAGGTAGTTTGAGSRNGAAARCGCGRRIRVTASVLALGPITCGICGQPFTTPDTPTTGPTVDNSDESDDRADEADPAGPIDDEDTAASVSRQHYIDTGHYLDTDGLCPCDEEGSA